MLNASTEFKNAIRENTKCRIAATVTLTNGTILNLSGSDFMMGASIFNDSTSASNTFQIGASPINTFDTVLNNGEGKFNEYDFTGAVIRPVILKDLSDSVESIPKGIYTIEQPDSVSTTIKIASYDNMRKFEVDYSNVGTSYPATLQTILADVCTYCGVVLNTNRFDNFGFVIEKRPDSSAMTCLDVVSFVAQISGNYARINVNGELELKWYNMTAFSESNYDGGTFSTNTVPYSDGANVDGGNFTDYTSGDTADGGLFTDFRPLSIYAFKSYKMCTDDVVITGIRTSVDTNTKYLKGTEGYVLELANNRFITEDNMQAIAEFVGNKIIGMRFRPFQATSLADPTIEAGDAVILSRNGAEYGTYITRTSYKIGAYETIQCNAETPAANSSAGYSASTIATVRARNEAKRQLDAYELSMKHLTDLMTYSFGVFKTAEVLADGSTIFYMHNKPLLEDSSTIWKMTANAFAVSTDGGKTWNAGFDSSGNVVLNVLSAIGINADWINAGSIVADRIIGGYLKSSNFVQGESGTYMNLNDGWFETQNGHFRGEIESPNATITGGSINIQTSDDDWDIISLICGTWKTLIRPGIVYCYDGQGHKAYVDGLISTIEVSDSSSKATMGPSTISVGNAASTSNYSCIMPKSISSGGLILSYGNMACTGNFSCSGTKKRVVETKSFEKVDLYCYEMASPMFGDIGESILDETGTSIIAIDDKLSETIDIESSYQVFLQKYGEGDLYVSERNAAFFVVKGTKGLKFAWEIKSIQRDYDSTRLEHHEEDAKPDEIESTDDATDYLSTLLFDIEREEI